MNVVSLSLASSLLLVAACSTVAVPPAPTAAPLADAATAAALHGCLADHELQRRVLLENIRHVYS